MANPTVILTKDAPAPIGPYSQALKVGNFLFCSGQVALDPTTGTLEGSDVETQTKKVMKNVQAVLKAGGCDFKNVIKTTIFLKNMGDFPKVNEIYGSFFRENPPARSTVEVARLPKDALVEIEVIASL